MKDRVNNLNHECINLIEAEVRLEVGSGQIMHIEVVQDTTKTLRARMRYSSNNRGSYGYNMRGNQRYGRNNNNRRGNYRNQVMIIISN